MRTQDVRIYICVHRVYVHTPLQHICVTRLSWVCTCVCICGVHMCMYLCISSHLREMREYIHVRAYYMYTRLLSTHVHIHIAYVLCWCDTLQHAATHCNTLQHIHITFVHVCMHLRISSHLRVTCVRCARTRGHRCIQCLSMQYVAVCCSMLQCVAVCCSVF